MCCIGIDNATIIDDRPIHYLRSIYCEVNWLLIVRRSKFQDWLMLTKRTQCKALYLELAWELSLNGHTRLWVSPNIALVMAFWTPITSSRPITHSNCWRESVRSSLFLQEYMIHMAPIRIVASSVCRSRQKISWNRKSNKTFWQSRTSRVAPNARDLLDSSTIEKYSKNDMRRICT